MVEKRLLINTEGSEDPSQVLFICALYYTDVCQVCRLQGCKNRAQSVTLPEVIKGYQSGA